MCTMFPRALQQNEISQFVMNQFDYFPKADVVQFWPPVINAVEFLSNFNDCGWILDVCVIFLSDVWLSAKGLWI